MFNPAKILPTPAKTGLKTVLSMIGQRLQYVPRKTRLFNAPDKQTFFGYYDTTPFSHNDRMLLACQTQIGNVSPHKTHPSLALGFYNLNEETPAFHQFSETKTWNWQQGCRLQWIDDSRVIYNTLMDDHYASVIKNIKTGVIEKSFPEPIYSISGDGRFALSLDFSKLHEYRPGYGYNNLPKAPSHNNIILIDLQSGAAQTIFTLQQAQNFAAHDDMRSAVHYFNHLCFNPGGTRFMVTHLWVTSNGARRTRILILDKEGEQIICPDNSGHTSHYCWEGDDKVLIFHSVRGHMGDYILYDLDANRQDIIAGKIFTLDGHPTLTPRLMLTDTYPDLTGLQHLMIYNRTTHAKRTLAKLHTPSGFFGECRCDLHPRLNHAGNSACIDVVRDGKRAMLLINFDFNKI